MIGYVFSAENEEAVEQETALKHWMVINYGVCLIQVEWRETESMAQIKTWDHGKLLNAFYLEWTKEGL